jgi:hypothetical protein
VGQKKFFAGAPFTAANATRTLKIAKTFIVNFFVFAIKLKFEN